MKFQYFYVNYVAFGIMACILAFFDMLYLSIAFRWLVLFVLSLIYFNSTKSNDFLFYLGVIFSGLGESMVVIGIDEFYKEINICFSLYYVLVIFLTRNSAKNIKYQVKIEQIVPLIISAFLTIFLVFYILDIITPQIKDNIIYSYIFLVSFLTMLSYLAILYISKHNKRYIWLLFLIVALISSTAMGTLESLYYQNKILKQGVFIIQLTSHLFLLKFLITPDEEVTYLG